MSLATTPRPHRWTRRDLVRMVESGVLDPEGRFELVDGEVFDMSMGRAHADAIAWATGVLVRAFGPEWVVRVQLYMALDDYNQPMPDFVLHTVRAMRLQTEDHPVTADLVIEVSDTSLRHDRIRKSRVYARSGLPEYWIVNLKERRLEVLRHPDREAGTWKERFVLEEDDLCRPLALPEKAIRVLDLLGLPPDA